MNSLRSAWTPVLAGLPHPRSRRRETPKVGPTVRFAPSYTLYRTGTKYRSGQLAAYSLSVFFILRVAGRFAGAWILTRFDWTSVLALFSGAILLCFLGTAYGGPDVAVYLLPLSGLFMSVIYPTINSKGISCFPKSEHGAVAGVILFFTCVSAVLGPLAMGAVSDAMGEPKYGFVLAAGFAALLFLGLLFNWILNPTRSLLGHLDHTEYDPAATV